MQDSAHAVGRWYAMRGWQVVHEGRLCSQEQQPGGGSGWCVGTVAEVCSLASMYDFGSFLVGVPVPAHAEEASENLPVNAPTLPQLTVVSTVLEKG